MNHPRHSSAAQLAVSNIELISLKGVSRVFIAEQENKFPLSQYAEAQPSELRDTADSAVKDFAVTVSLF